jgi:hypothetical protein
MILCYHTPRRRIRCTNHTYVRIATRNRVIVNRSRHHPNTPSPCRRVANPAPRGLRAIRARCAPGDADAATLADADHCRAGAPHTAADGHADARAHADTQADADTDTKADPDADTSPHADAHGDAGAHADAAAPVVAHPAAGQPDGDGQAITAEFSLAPAKAALSSLLAHPASKQIVEIPPAGIVKCLPDIRGSRDTIAMALVVGL